MSRIPRSVLGLALAGAAAAAFGAAPAQAAITTTVHPWQCKLPSAGVVPLTLTLGFDAPASWPQCKKTDRFPVTASFAFGGGAAEGLESIEGLARLVSVSQADKPGRGSALRVSVVQSRAADEGTFKLRLPLTVTPLEVSPPLPRPAVIDATGAWPEVSYDWSGPAYTELYEVLLNLRALDAQGNPLSTVRTPVTDVDGAPFADLDGDPTTFNLPCRRVPGEPPAPKLFETNVLAPCSSSCGGGDSTPPDAPGLPPVTGPGAYVPGDFGATAINLRWSEPVDRAPVGTTPVGLKEYVITYEGAPAGGLIVPAPATSKWITGLGADSAYDFEVIAVDKAGNRSARLLQEGLATVPDSPPVDLSASYTATGSTQIRTLTKGTLNLKGAFDAVFEPAAGTFTADLTLGDTTGRLVALGFLPVTAKIGFSPSGKTTGTLVGGALTTSSKVRIKVKEAKLFGAIPLVGGNACQTKQLSEISLKSVGSFQPAVGGKLSGTYKISDLNGCGALNGLVSPLTAGAGNTLTLDLARAPEPAS